MLREEGGHVPSSGPVIDMHNFTKGMNLIHDEHMKTNKLHPSKGHEIL